MFGLGYFVNKMLRFFQIFFLLIPFAIGTHSADAVQPEEILEINPYLSVDRVPAGSSLEVALEVVLKSGWHVNSNRPSYEFAIPTELSFEELPGLTVDEILFPEAHLKLPVPGTSESTEIFDSSFIVLVKASVSNDAVPGDYLLRGWLSYQGCDNHTCLRPVDKAFTIELPVVAAGKRNRTVNAGIFARAKGEAVEAEKSVPDKGFLDTGDVSGLVAERGLVVTLLLVFLGGLALNLTPCVYPLIPITISYFGGRQGEGSPVPAAVAYLLGICIMYSSLGLFAALSGKMFGTMLSNPLVLILIAGLMTALALSMFGLYDLRLPTALMNIGGTARSGVLGAMTMGLTMGIVAAPCIGPFVIGLLTYVATLGSPVKGFLLFFALSLGLGLPYLFLGIFSGRISSLPKSGEWMIGVRKIFGCVLLAMAVYFLQPLLPQRYYHLLMALVLLLSGLFLIIMVASDRGNRLFHVLKSLVAVGMVFAAAWLVKPDAGRASGLPWTPYSDQKLEEAAAGGLPVVIDFAADWCIPCKELDEITFRDPQVLKFSDKMVFLRVDLSVDTPEKAAIKERYGISGVPTVIFLDSGGNEISDLRLTGFEEPEPFTARLKLALDEK